MENASGENKYRKKEEYSVRLKPAVGVGIPVRKDSVEYSGSVKRRDGDEVKYSQGDTVEQGEYEYYGDYGIGSPRAYLSRQHFRNQIPQNKAWHAKLARQKLYGVDPGEMELSPELQAEMDKLSEARYKKGQFH